MTQVNPLAPRFTLTDIFGPGYVFIPRASFTPYGWGSTDPAILEALTGGQLTVAGELPVLCHQAVATEAGFGLLRAAGIEPGTNLLLYQSEAEYRRHLRTLIHDQLHLIFQHIYPPDEVPADHYWIAPSLLSLLNNKAQLDKLAPSAHTPRRQIVRPADWTSTSIQGMTLPAVVKAAVDQSTGGGFDVKICRTNDDLAQAREVFQACDALVIEQFLPIQQNFCVHFVATQEQTISCLGATEQIVDSQGRWQGGWLDSSMAMPESVFAVGHAIMERAVALGYTGIAGFDMALLPDGHVVVYDLNFRFNGSTVALLFYDSIVHKMARPVMRLRSWRWDGAFHDLVAAVQPWVEQGLLVPLATYDAAASPYAIRGSRLGGLLLGTSREEVVEHEARLAAVGLI